MLWLAYPLLIFFGLQILEPRYVAMLLALTLVLRRRNQARQLLADLSRADLAGLAGLLALAVLTAMTNSEILLRLYPVAVNLCLLVLFGLSLRKPPSMIERFARLNEPNLSPDGVSYTRRVTQIWCGFFVLNGAISAYTVFYSSRAYWSLYNGLIAYLLMGILLGGEWLVRRHVASQSSV